MKNVLILNGHQPGPFANGDLNQAFVARAQTLLRDRGAQVEVTKVSDGFDIETEIDRHLWADALIFQFPVNWMGLPWVFKKYMDEVYTAGMDGRLAHGDGRRSDAPNQHYGMGGSLKGLPYMISATFNAPKSAFDDPAQPFFQGGSVDDLFRPIHLTMKFMDARPRPTFAAHDVVKNPSIADDFVRFDAHLSNQFFKDLPDVAA